MFTAKQFWLLFHLGLGVLCVHAFAGGFATLFGERVSRRRDIIRTISTVGMAVVTWATVVAP